MAPALAGQLLWWDGAGFSNSSRSIQRLDAECRTFMNTKREELEYDTDSVGGRCPVLFTLMPAPNALRLG